MSQTLLQRLQSVGGKTPDDVPGPITQGMWDAEIAAAKKRGDDRVRRGMKRALLFDGSEAPAKAAPLVPVAPVVTSPAGSVDARSEGRIATLIPEVRQPFRDLLIAINAEFAKLGKPWKWKWISGYRGKAEQDALYDQPRDGKDNDGDGRVDEADERVTGARFPYSAHNSGVGADGGVFAPDGDYIDEGIGYDIAGAIGRKMGFSLGADFGDRAHFALRPPSLRALSETAFINAMAKRIVNNLPLWV